MKIKKYNRLKIYNKINNVVPRAMKIHFGDDFLSIIQNCEQQLANSLNVYRLIL